MLSELEWRVGKITQQLILKQLWVSNLPAALYDGLGLQLLPGDLPTISLVCGSCSNLMT